MNIMLDIETLSTRPDAAVFEVAAVPFSADGVIDDAPHLHVTFPPSTGHIDVGTVQWWLDRAKKCSLRNRPLMIETEAAQDVHDFLAWPDRAFLLWAKPASFDCVILQQWLERNGYKMPVSFRNWRDVRTVCELAGWPEVEKREGHVTHNALHDCIWQIDTLVECWRRLKK